MQSFTRTPYLQSDLSLVFGGIKIALAKFPTLRNPVSRARIFERSLNTDTRILSPRVYYRANDNYEPLDIKTKRIRQEMLDAGVTAYGLLKSESRYLPKILHPHEHVEAVIYGQHNSSSAMMIATDERIIYLDKKPMAELFDEVSYEVVSGIEFDIHMFFATVVLHTAVKNYDFKMVNLRCAEKFARHIEKHRLEREPKQPGPDAQQIQAIPRQGIVNDKLPANYMAGYYWLPADEEERRKIQTVNV
jgi:hypothetical protein